MNSAPLSTVDIAMMFLIKLLRLVCKQTAHTMSHSAASFLEDIPYILFWDHHHCTKKRKDWPNVLLGFTSLSAASRLARNLNSQLNCLNHHHLQFLGWIASTIQSHELTILQFFLLQHLQILYQTFGHILHQKTS